MPLTWRVPRLLQLADGRVVETVGIPYDEDAGPGQDWEAQAAPQQRGGRAGGPSGTALARQQGSRGASTTGRGSSGSGSGAREGGAGRHRLTVCVSSQACAARARGALGSRSVVCKNRCTLLAALQRRTATLRATTQRRNNRPLRRARPARRWAAPCAARSAPPARAALRATWRHTRLWTR